jgi:hypothetical protein
MNALRPSLWSSLAKQASTIFIACARSRSVRLFMPLLHGVLGRGHGERRVLRHHLAVGRTSSRARHRHHLAHEAHAQRFLGVELARRHEDVGGVGGASTFMKRRTPAGL